MFVRVTVARLRHIMNGCENKQIEEVKSVDINDLFDDIVLTEQHSSRAAYQEGFTAGSVQGSHEGYQLGYAQGVQLGQELGAIYGNVVAQQQLPHTEKVKRTLQQLRASIESFPRTNDADFDLIGAVEKLRILQRKLNAMLCGKTSEKQHKEQRKDYSF